MIESPSMLFRFTNRTIKCVLYLSNNAKKYFEQKFVVDSIGPATLLYNWSSENLFDAYLSSIQVLLVDLDLSQQAKVLSFADYLS